MLIVQPDWVGLHSSMIHMVLVVNFPVTDARIGGGDSSHLILWHLSLIYRTSPSSFARSRSLPWLLGSKWSCRCRATRWLLTWPSTDQVIQHIIPLSRCKTRKPQKTKYLVIDSCYGDDFSGQTVLAIKRGTRVLFQLFRKRRLYFEFEQIKLSCQKIDRLFDNFKNTESA